MRYTIPVFDDVVGETAYERGHRLLVWMCSNGVVGTLADVDLQRADVACGTAIVQATDEPMRQRLSGLRHWILSELNARQKEAQRTTQPTCAEGKPNVGPMAPLQKPAPTRPPEPVELDIQF